eukprot:264184-Prorocentrum_lima.AAC.1
MAGRLQRAMYALGFHLRTDQGVPRSQVAEHFDFEDCSGAGSLPMVRGVATADAQGRPSVECCGVCNRVQEAAEEALPGAQAPMGQ